MDRRRSTQLPAMLATALLSVFVPFTVLADEPASLPLDSMGTALDPSDVSLSPEAALALARQAGLEDGARGPELVRPLAPGAGPLYVFRDGRGVLVVDVATRQAVRVDEDRAPAADRGRIQPGVSLWFVSEATRRIREIARSAIVIWAGGMREDGTPLERPEDTDRWDAIAIAPNGYVPLAWRIHYDGVWTISPLAQPPFGILFLDLTTVRMDVSEAWRLAVAAGFQPPFAWWGLQQSLHPDCKNPFYVFPYGGGYILVDTVTGDVTTEE